MADQRPPDDPAVVQTAQDALATTKFGAPCASYRAKPKLQAEKAIRQVCDSVEELLGERSPAEQAHALAKLFSERTWTHDYPISFQMAQDLGLPVSAETPKESFERMQ